jgi:hypothetical protein
MHTLPDSVGLPVREPNMRRITLTGIHGLSTFRDKEGNHVAQYVTLLTPYGLRLTELAVAIKSIKACYLLFTIPKQVETSLKLNEEPLADTARYDSLSDKEVKRDMGFSH